MPLRPSILKVVAYFDLFNYPVTLEEIRFFMDREAPAPALTPELDALVAEKRLFRLGAFYSLRNDPLLTERRLKGNRHADELLRIADRISRFLYQFPYVKGIGISGSLSKHYEDEDADIDYFIITSSNRLWIARTLMHLFKKWSFIRGRQHWYCMNYFVDEEALEIEEKNIFTATELITLLPACGNGGLGFGVAGSVGLRMGDPERPVIGVVGDGSSMYAIQALWSAAHYEVGVLLLVMANGRYAVMDGLARQVGAAAAWPSRTVSAGRGTGFAAHEA